MPVLGHLKFFLTTRQIGVFYQKNSISTSYLQR